MWTRAVVIYFLLLAGCGGDSGPQRQALYGQVSVQGQPVAKGAINFFPASGTSGPAAFAVIENGAYRFTKESGPFVGKHRVVIDLNYQSRDDAMKATNVKNIKDPAAAIAPTTRTQWEEEFAVPGDGKLQKDFILQP